MQIIVWLLIGLIAGWLSGLIVKGHGFGMLGNIVVGIIGALVGGFLFSVVGLEAYGFLASVVMATAGAVVLLVLVRALKRA